MLSTWYNLAMLAVESQSVVALRIIKISHVDPNSIDEGYLMVSEKVNASARAFSYLVSGGSLNSVIHGYRKLVQANVHRLVQTS